MATPSSLEWVFLWLEKRLGLVKAPHFYLHNDPTVIAAIKCGVQRLHTTVVSGGVQVFFSSLLARVGLLEPAYSPYGHEDHEFSIRAERAGYRNYTTCDVFAVHGIDERHPMREHSWSKEVYARRRAISTRKVLRSPVVRILVLGEIVLHTVVTSAVSNLLSGDLTFPSVKSGIRGFIDGATTPLINTEKLIDRAEAAKRAAG
jgi:GT2 family glycosyltransferase